jgi:hypothetical protein
LNILGLIKNKFKIMNKMEDYTRIERFRLGKITHHQTLMLEIWRYLDLKDR